MRKKEISNENNIFFWRGPDLDSYKNLAEILGEAAKYQIYALLFGNKKNSEVGNISVPAMKGGKGENKFYCFLIQPEKLFKIAYVNRREKSNPRDTKNTYQRMVDKKRIESIGKFIDEGNSFPNNIILSFDKNKNPIFERFKYEDNVGEIVYGLLKFPPYYGCAWVIDGQHRLYGYSKSKNASKHTVPVIAFESLSIKKQANLFVDINQEQKPVTKNLLWDLYPDIYYDSEDELY